MMETKDIIEFTIAAILSFGIYFLIFRYIYRILKRKFNLKLSIYLIILASILLIVVCVYMFTGYDDIGELLSAIAILPIIPIIFLYAILSGRPLH